MKQDRRTNGWVVVGSIVELIVGFCLLIVGGATALGGFFYVEQLDKLADLQFFLAQERILNLIVKFKLTPKFVYLYLGIIVAVIGLATLIFAIVALNYAKKHKVVRRRVALLFHTLFALAVAGCAVAYFVLGKDVLTDNIKYVLYGAMGVYGFVGLCKLLGVMSGRSEQFMSNDNSKYATNNRLIHQQISARPVQTQGMEPRQAHPMQNQTQMTGHPRPVATNQTQPMRPMQSAPNANAQPMRPIQQGARTMQGQARVMPNGPTNQAVQRPMAGQPHTAANSARPAQAPNPSQPTRPMPQGARPMQGQPRPMPTGNQTVQRPMTEQVNRPTPTQRPTQPSRRYCPMCGKLLNPDERICSVCGHKVSE